MKNKKFIFSVLFTGILFLNTFLFTDINENKLQLNSLFTLATAQVENVENGEDSYSSYDCMGKQVEQVTKMDCGSSVYYAFKFKCEGTSGPCCEGWLECWYDVVPGQTTSADYKDDQRIHTRCETVN